MSGFRIAFSVLVTATLAIIPDLAFAALDTPFKNFPDVVRAANFSQLGRIQSVKRVKVAVLDNGFKGYADELGRTLPASAIYHAGPIPVDPNNEETHGLFMAQMVSDLLTNETPNVDFEIHMFSAFGYTNLASATDYVIKNKFDVVLYSQVWEYGGNGDGRGFINKVVSRATAAGILWVNASGNFADGTFRGPVAIGQDNFAKLPGPGNTVRIRCDKNAQGKCPLRVVLTWNDFKEDVSTGTDKDLDLLLIDENQKMVTNSIYHQMKSVPNPAPEGASLYPREFVETLVDPGTYYVRVQAQSHNFDKNRDAMRITVSGNHVTLLDQTPGETLLPPADNSSVITVGSNDTPKSSFSKSLRKPELETVSLIETKNGQSYAGTSNSAAIVAAAVAALRSKTPSLDRSNAIRDLANLMPARAIGRPPARPPTAPVQPLPPRTQQGDGDDQQQGDDDGGADQGQQPGQPQQPTNPPPQPSSAGLDLSLLQFGPTGERCFQQAQLPVIPLPLNGVLQQGAIVVQSTAGFKVFTEQDPFTTYGIRRIALDDMLVVNSSGIFPRPRRLQSALPYGNYEIVQLPRGQSICDDSSAEQPQQPSPYRPGSGRRAPGLPIHAPVAQDMTERR